MRQRLRDAWAYRELLLNLVMRDLKVRYRNSFFGFLWALGNPLLMMAVFTVVFTVLWPQEVVQVSGLHPVRPAALELLLLVGDRLDHQHHPQCAPDQEGVVPARSTAGINCRVQHGELQPGADCPLRRHGALPHAVHRLDPVPAGDHFVQMILTLGIAFCPVSDQCLLP